MHSRLCSARKAGSMWIPQGLYLQWGQQWKITRMRDHIGCIVSTSSLLTLWGGADKSLARPGRKQATATKLGIYSTYSPRSSICFLAHCSYFCKQLKKNTEVVCPTRSPWLQWPLRLMKDSNLSIVFFSPGNRW